MNHYSNKKVVESYGSASDPLPEEETLMQVLGDALAKSRMLDIGVGGGRTTCVFAPKVLQYTAIDISKEMIDFCLMRFSGDFPKSRFLVGCASSFGQLMPDEQFDFILFSFNGIDHLDHDLRLKCLSEVYSKLTPGGFFAFSSHNLNRKDFRKRAIPIKISANPIKLAWRLGRYIKARLSWQFKNRKVDFDEIERVGYGRIWEEATSPGAGGFSHMYYISRENARKQIEQVGFSFVRTIAALEQESDNRWIYYLCQKPD